MAAAVAAARVHQGRTGSTWGEALSVTLKATWQQGGQRAAWRDPPGSLSSR
jgi:hypothetical protein